MNGASATPHLRDRREETDGDGRAWLHWAVGEIEADAARSADTHLIKVPLAGLDGIQIYFKDESTHPSGSLKHRLARSLFLYALCNDWVRKGTPVIEASSGSTAISEAYFARLLGLRFIAVVLPGTAAAKLAEIEPLGGECHFAAGGDIYSAAERLARSEERRGGKECVSTCRSRWSPDH